MSRAAFLPAGRPLVVAGWAHNAEGEIVNGQLRSTGGVACFKHSLELRAEDVWGMRVERGLAIVGIAAEELNVDSYGETWSSTAYVELANGTTFTRFDISEDGRHHYYESLLKDYIPKTLPYDVALRITKDGSSPQIQFNDDAVWHDFVPEGGAALKAGPWYPYLMAFPGECLSDHRVNRLSRSGTSY